MAGGFVNYMEGNSSDANATANDTPPATETDSTNSMVNTTAGAKAMPSLPSNPDDLLAQGWNETTDPRMAAAGRRTFINPTTGEQVEFDLAQPAGTGFKADDHYHVLNPDTTSKLDYYLDQNGNPVPKGSTASHIPPNQ